MLAVATRRGSTTSPSNDLQRSTAQLNSLREHTHQSHSRLSRIDAVNFAFGRKEISHCHNVHPVVGDICFDGNSDPQVRCRVQQEQDLIKIFPSLTWSSWNTITSDTTPPIPYCTYTAYTEPVIQAGPTSTYYSLTTYTSELIDCHGCGDVVMIVLGHVFLVSPCDSCSLLSCVLYKGFLFHYLD